MAEIVGAHGRRAAQPRGRTCSAPTGTPPTTPGASWPSTARAGEVKLWTSTYTPFFGAEELALVRTLAALTALALDRARLFSHEREMREALERADEIKTNFVSLAAHELRTPVATIHGLVETIYAPARRARAGPGRRARDRPARTDDADEGARRAAARPLAARGRRGRHPADGARDPAARRGDRRSRRSARTRAWSRSTSTRGSSRRSTPTRSTGSSPTSSSTRAATARLRSASPPRRTTGTSASPSRTRVRACRPSSCPTCSSASRGARGSRARSGTGLGLAIARSYAQAHRGDLIYEPAQPHGARFQLVLPVRTAVAAECGREDSNLQGLSPNGS